MEVARLRRAVERHHPGDEREVESCRRLVAELDRLPRPFDESADPIHVTASGIVVGPRGVILHKHRRLGRWLQPGGHLEPGESQDVAWFSWEEAAGLADDALSGALRAARSVVGASAAGEEQEGVR